MRGWDESFRRQIKGVSDGRTGEPCFAEVPVSTEAFRTDWWCSVQRALYRAGRGAGGDSRRGGGVPDARGGPEVSSVRQGDGGKTEKTMN